MVEDKSGWGWGRGRDTLPVPEWVPGECPQSNREFPDPIGAGTIMFPNTIVVFITIYNLQFVSQTQTIITHML